LAKEQCVKRHDTGISQLYLNICKEIEVKLDNENLSDHVQKLVETSRESKVQGPTDRPISDNRSYIIIGGNTKGTYIFVDVAIAGDRNAIKKLAEKIMKYKDLNSRNTAYLECKNKCDTSNTGGQLEPSQNHSENT
jgi:hypothetical protein